MMPRSVLAPAKVNLSLRVLGRRADGYHLLDSLVVFTEFGDQLSLHKNTGNRKSRLNILGEFADGIDVETNLVTRAMDRLAATSGVDLADVTVDLLKQIPVAAGLGGGSADAAAALMAMADIFTDINPKAICKVAESLGADIPMCLNNKPKFVSGIGHDLQEIEHIPAADLILVNPRIELSTADIFDDLNMPIGETETLRASGFATGPSPFKDISELVTFVKAAGNDLAEPAIKRAPEIADILKALEKAGALHAQMSGSGATCYGLCESGRAISIMEALDIPPTWWRVATAIS